MKGVIEAELFAMDAEVVESICDAEGAPRSITLARHGAAYRGGEKGPQGSGTKAVSICVAWTHRGVERYAGVFPCFRRSKKHPQTSVVDPKWIFWSRLPNLATHEITRDT